MKAMNVYIDGACVHNGKSNARAGYAVYFGPDDTRNEYNQVQGKQSNNTGELTAFIRCMQKIQNETHVNIFTDSEYVMKCITSYGKKLEAINWKKDVPNIELVQQAYELYKNADHVKIHYIAAHTNKDDIHSIGNSEADRLARLSIGKEPNTVQEIVCDWITFFTKDKAKALGAKWNLKKKYWYVLNDISEENMQELLKLRPTVAKQYIKIGFAQKDKAKALGAKWDAREKSWYYFENEISEENKKQLQEL